MKLFPILCVCLVVASSAIGAEKLIDDPKLRGNLDLTGLRSATGRFPLVAVPLLDPNLHVASAVDARLAGLTASDTTKKLFSTYNPGTDSYVLNSSCWAGAVDTTCISVSPALLPCTLISQDIVAGPNHAGIPSPIKFRGSDGVIYTRTVTATLQVGSTDILLGKIAALPAAVRPARILPTGYASALTLVGLPVLKLDQERKALVGEVQSVGSLIQLLAVPADAQRAAFSEGWIVNDSGSGFFLVVDDSLAMLGAAWHGLGTDDGPNYPLNLAAIQSTCTTLGGTAPQLTPLPSVIQKLPIGSLVPPPTLTAVAGSVPKLDGAGRLPAAVMPTGLVYEGSLGGNGAADSGKVAVFGADGRLKSTRVVIGSFTETTSSTFWGNIFEDAVVSVMNRSPGGGIGIQGDVPLGDINSAGVFGSAIAGNGVVGTSDSGTGVNALSVSGVPLSANTSSITSDIQVLSSPGKQLTVKNNGSLDWSDAQATADTRTELEVPRLVTKATTGNPTATEPTFVINTFDNTLKIWAEGAWRTLATW